MISVQGLKVEFSSQLLFDDVSFVVNKNDRIALVGRNGAGKSTLLKILKGIQNPTSGVVSRERDITIGYLPQEMKFTDDTSLKQEVKKVFSYIDVLDCQIEDLNNELSNRTDYNSESYQGIVELLSWKIEQRANFNVNSMEGEIEKTLIGLGFEKEDFERNTSEFSGGWRMRVEIAKILLVRPDILLLDEPTNHLDIESIQWLENFLRRNKSALVLVSHDKAFVDRTTNRTIEISLGKIYDYKVNYSKFIELRKERIEQLQRAYANQQKYIQDTEEFIERFRYKATKAVQVQSRIKQLDKIKLIEVEQEDTSRIRLKFPPAKRSGDYPLIAEELGKSYGDHVVFEGVDYSIKRGEKVAFVGKNGSGKTTMVKCIMGQIPYNGTLTIGHNVEIGYFAQNQAQMLDESLTVFETIDYVATGDIRTRINDLLGAFMFGGEKAEKKVKVLSGGEKSRLAMIKLLLEPVNFLILDEPTNHLDMATKNILKEALQAFDGTLIVVSHDRDFLDGLVDKVYEFTHKKVIKHLCGIYEFLEKKQLTSLDDIDAENHQKESKTVAIEEPSASKLDYLAQKEYNRKIKSVERAIETVENDIAAAEAELEEINAMLANGNVQDNAIYERHGVVSKKLEQAMKLWEEKNEELNILKNEN